GTLNLTEDKQYKINAFDWQEEFKEAFQDGGFDVVIGNPPYGAGLLDSERLYLDNKFNVGNTDTAALFLLQAKTLLNAAGITGFIIPKAFTYASNWQKIRNIILPDIKIIADCGRVWQEVKLEMSICINQKNNKQRSFVYYKRNDETITKFGSKKRTLCTEFDLMLNGVNEQETAIGLKMKRNNKVLNDFVENQRGGMFQGKVSQTGYFAVLGGKQIQRYIVASGIRGKIAKKDVPDDDKIFIKDNAILVQNIVAHVMKPYPRIIITACCSGVLKEVNRYVILDTVNQLQNVSDLSSYYILAILNSRLIAWYAYRFIFANAIRTMHFDNQTTAKIPFAVPTQPQHDKLVKLVERMLELKTREVNEQNQHTKTMIERQITALDNDINEVVYALYDLTEDEINVVDGKR
ncbi:MAG: Eco57I restriction-modification methylase domain-containing protein, partial [Planctomycetaceae bacterium]|nr:Eco57I restriction-modification methylase domain-containing protein [Planctomycetaceae bacterium]